MHPIGTLLSGETVGQGNEKERRGQGGAAPSLAFLVFLIVGGIVYMVHISSDGMGYQHG